MPWACLAQWRRADSVSRECFTCGYLTYELPAGTRAITLLVKRFRCAEVFLSTQMLKSIGAHIDFEICDLRAVQTERSSPTLEESYRRATTQKPITDRVFTRMSRAGNPKRQLSNCQSRVRLLKQRHSLRYAQMPWGGHPLVVAGPLAYLPPGTVGQWPTCHLTMVDRVRKGGDPKTDQEGTTRTPGLASRRERAP